MTVEEKAAELIYTFACMKGDSWGGNYPYGEPGSSPCKGCGTHGHGHTSWRNPYTLQKEKCPVEEAQNLIEEGFGWLRSWTRDIY